ncbi:MAG: tripartite tricarboxylate transporter substrate binding protein [Burkholderiales bacterium]
MGRTRFIRLWALVPLLAAGAEPALCDWRPSRNVEIVASAAPGGGNDAVAQLIQRVFQEQRLVGSATVVLKRGRGVAALSYVNQHAGDGHYLAITTPALLTNRLVGDGPLTHADVTPIATLSSEYMLVAVRADSPIATGGELSSRLRGDASSVSFGFGSAVGNLNHVTAGLLVRAAGGDVRRLRVRVYDAGTKALAAAASGEVDAVVATAGSLLVQARTKKMRLLGLTAPRRLGGPLTGVPTWKEQGLDVVLSSWRGVAGPRGLTPEQVAYWEEAFLKLTFTGEWLDELNQRSLESTYLNSSETRRFLDAQSSVLRNALTDLGLAK